MKFRFIWIGKTKDRNWKALQQEFLQRLSHFVKCELTELKESAPHEDPDIEGERILAALNPKTFAVLLDVKGEAITSPGLADKIENWQNRGIKEVSFVIGGANGVSRRVAQSWFIWPVARGASVCARTVGDDQCSRLFRTRSMAGSDSVDDPDEGPSPG